MGVARALIVTANGIDSRAESFAEHEDGRVDPANRNPSQSVTVGQPDRVPKPQDCPSDAETAEGSVDTPDCRRVQRHAVHAGALCCIRRDWLLVPANSGHVAPRQARKRRDTEPCTGVKRERSAESGPQPARHTAGHQQGHTADQIEETVSRAPKVRRRSVCHHGRQQALGHAHVHAPQAHA